METIILALSPLVVALITQGVKKIRMKNFYANGWGKKVLRVVVAILSYGAIVGTALLTGGKIDPVTTETFVQTLLVFLSSTGVYYFAKK